MVVAIVSAGLIYHMCLFFFNATATTEIYTLSLPDALPISAAPRFLYCPFLVAAAPALFIPFNSRSGSAPAFYTAHILLRQRPGFLYYPFLVAAARSEGTRLNSITRPDLVCRLLLEKKKKSTPMRHAALARILSSYDV